MNPYVWKEQNLTGLPQIDSDHQALFRLASQLQDDIRQGTAWDSLGGHLSRLISYAGFHFEAEESLMLQTSFPDYNRHRREHETFTEKLLSLRSVSRHTNNELAEALMLFLANWLEDHTCGSDHRMAEHIKENMGESA